MCCKSTYHEMQTFSSKRVSQSNIQRKRSTRSEEYLQLFERVVRGTHQEGDHRAHVCEINARASSPGAPIQAQRFAK